MAKRAVVVANTFLDIAAEHDSILTHMKLQKLVYYAHGWHLAIFDEPLIREGVEAWRFGPVVDALYHQFKSFGSEQITRKAITVKLEDGKVVQSRPALKRGSHEFALAERIWEIYSPYSAIQLSNATHANGTPWQVVASEFHGDPPAGIQIPDELITQHFKNEVAS